MATTSHEQRRQRQQPDSQQDGAERQPVDLQSLEHGQDLSPEMAGVLQPQLGNVALQEMLGHTSSDLANAAVSALDEEEEQIEELVEAEDLAEDLELEGVSFGGGGGGSGGAGGAGDPWEVGQLFGGDDDDDTPNRPRARPKVRHRKVHDDEDDDPFDDEPEEEVDRDALDPAHLAPVERRLGTVAPPDKLVGDARYQAPIGALDEALFLGRRRLTPEALISIDSPSDPIGRPAEIGRFLAAAADAPRARALGRLLSHGTAALCPSVGGFAGAAARMAAIAVCAEAAEGGGMATDRAVRLALTDSAWSAAVTAAQPAQRRGQLRAHVVLQVALGTTNLPEQSGRLPPPGPLGGRALRRLMPPAMLSSLPRLDFAALAPPPPEMDDDLARMDAVIRELTGAAPPPLEPVLERRSIQPLLTATRTLMMAMGRSFVEVAAAAIAVRRVRPDAPVRAVVARTDRTIATLAKTTLKAGRTIERSVGYQLRHLDAAELEGAASDLRYALDALEAVKDWAFDSLAGALDV